jgi:hypothetical protein
MRDRGDDFLEMFFHLRKAGGWNVKKPEFIPTPAFYLNEDCTVSI